MFFKTKLKIELDPNFESYEEMEPGSTYGIIKIGDFYEHFYMSSSWWSIDDYLKQWKLALKRIQSNNESCFIVNVQLQTPLIEMWNMYKDGKIIYIQNRMLFGKYYQDAVRSHSVTPESVFEFIPKKEINSKDDPIQEWKVEISDT